MAESDERMLAAALQLIGERGYRGTTLAAVGEAAGYSRGLVHARFGSKAGLLWALVKRMLAVWDRQGARARRAASTHSAGETRSKGIQRICDLLDNHRKAIEQQVGVRAFYALMFEAVGPTPELLPEFQRLHRSFRAQLAEMLEEGVLTGEIRADVDIDAQAALLMATIRGIGFQWLLDPQGFDTEPAYAELKRHLRRTLEP